MLQATAQLSGTIRDAGGTALSYVTVYKDGTSTGTVSNIDGQYSLDLPNGQHTIVFKYVGYDEVRKVLSIDGPSSVDVTLNESVLELDQVVISADAEDPAYRVIRQAIKAREDHKSEVLKHQVDLYVKGVVKMLKTPTKILGQEIGDMDGMLDTTGQGIVYLAESQSTLSFHQPDLFKEEMYSSIVAEDDGSYNFNQFQNTNFDIYNEYYEFERSIMAPLADNALTYYKYEMLESKIDASGNLVNRIQVIPKSDSRPLVFGEIYIIEDSWTVKELDLGFTGKAIKQPIFDTIRMQQVHLPVEGDKWKVFTQTMSFTLGSFGFKVGGGFTYVFRDYDFDPSFDQSFFGSEHFSMDASAIKVDSSFWTTVRPIKLTEEERLNYIKKDSLKKVWSSKEYQDSVDRKNNKFVLGDFLFGYSYADSYNKRYMSYSSPLTTYKFNPVTGHSLEMGLDYVKIDSAENRRFNLNTKLGYGFSDKRLKLEALAIWRTSRTYQENWSLGIGDANRQINEQAPMSAFVDTWYSLYFKRNLARYYRKQYAHVGYQREVANGVYVRSLLGYARRSALSNITQYSWRLKDELYASNHPLFDGLAGDALFPTNNHFVFRAEVRLRIGQTYSQFPKFRVRNSSKWPDLWIKYEKALSIGDTDYDKLSINIKKNDINYRLFGHSNFNIIASTFLQKKSLSFVDYHHFLSNENILTLRGRYTRGFKMMPHYRYSTTDDYVAGFYEHHFDGFLLDAVPLIKRLGWSSVVSGNALIRSNSSNYYELSAGISDIKIGALSLFRMDYVWSYDNSILQDRGLRIGLSAFFE